MVRLSVPNSPYELTPLWLTEALHYKPSSSNASVTSYAVEVIGEGKGFMHQIARLKLDYDDAPKDLPRTIIIKLPSTDPDAKAISDKLGDHEREARFYEGVATNDSIRTPYCYYSAIDLVTGHAVLLLQDLGDAHKQRLSLPHAYWPSSMPPGGRALNCRIWTGCP